VKGHLIIVIHFNADKMNQVFIFFILRASAFQMVTFGKLFYGIYTASRSLKNRAYGILNRIITPGFFEDEQKL
jgi:hypothetical protein